VSEAIRHAGFLKPNDEVINFVWPVVPQGAEIASKWLHTEQEKLVLRAGESWFSSRVTLVLTVL
jgi:hypothetical protein